MIIGDIQLTHYLKVWELDSLANLWEVLLLCYCIHMSLNFLGSKDTRLCALAQSHCFWATARQLLSVNWAISGSLVA